ncbi:Ammonium transporter Rh type B [Eumeta japonica]|uniref:Ammonium transporter Rh type B n=1 Tax=Eumeta variegata TaxID=151549 RepID=A0A4C1YEN7_EUMVA|nr:Ammonium transporter Rh type B [Eumeta japonica]
MKVPPPLGNRWLKILNGFEDTHVMIFIGFGFLMTFLKRYSYSALGFNWLLAALVVQWAIVCQQFYEMKNYEIFINKKTLLEADIMSATVLITFGALLGVASGVQLLFIAVVEVAVACANMYLVNDVFKATDVGGSIAIHTFGAYFGLGVSLALRSKKGDSDTGNGQAAHVADLAGPSYASDVTAMIGSIFLWIYWPSFNSGLADTPEGYQRAVINTYLSLAASTVTSFVLSALVSKHEGRFDMVHVQNSTLAGGVAVGSVCNLYTGPGGALAVGIGAGIISPRLAKFGILDTCGVNNLHGMPGVYSGLLSILFAGLATEENYGDGLHKIFKAMDPAEYTPARTAGGQALYQLAALVVTLVLSFGSGLITGFITKLPIFDRLKESEKYDDEVNWELP